MQHEIEGGDCLFDLNLQSPRLLPVAFGGRKTIGNEQHFHSHPGEALAACFGALKNRHFLWGVIFTLMMDCRAMVWLMSYEGNNHAVKRLQLELLGFWFTIVNRPGGMLADANYFSRINANIHIDPLLKDYLTIARQMRSKYPPTEGLVTQDNLPGRRKQKHENSTETKVLPSNFASLDFSFTSSIIESEELCTIDLDVPLMNIPVRLENTTSVHSSNKNYNSDITQTAAILKSYQWCLYNPRFGNFIQACQQSNIPFETYIAIEPSQSCRDFLQQYFKVPIIRSSIDETIQCLQVSTAKLKIQGYYATLSFDLVTELETENLLFTHQSHLIKELSQSCDLSIFIIELYDAFNKKEILSFRKSLDTGGWSTRKLLMNFEHFSDKIANNCTIIFGYRREFFELDLFFDMHKPPQQPIDMNPHIDSSINLERFSIPYLSDLFEIAIGVSSELRKPEVEAIIKPKNLTDVNNNGYEIYNTDHPAPIPTSNTGGLFGELFGILFIDSTTKKQHCRSISHYEYSSMFLYERAYSWKISESPHILSTLRHTTPYRTLHHILSVIFEHLDTKRNEEIDNHPAVFFNGIISHELPNEYAWMSAYKQDEQCSAMMKMVEDPSLITEENLKKLHYVYRQPLRDSQIILTDDRLYYLEPVASSHKIARLIIVPEKLQHHIFAAFHSNPLGGHFGIYHTFHRIRLRYHWPNMYNLIRKRIEQCPGCILKTAANRPSSELLYSFPADAPFMTITGDIWSPGKTEGFDGASALMIILCYMTGFVAIEPIKGTLTSKNFAKAAYRIMLRYGLPHLFVSDPDTKFHGEFKEMCKILKIEHHISAKGNHQAILVERFNKFLNSSLKIFNTSRGSNRVFVEGADLTVYAWNSAPVSGTDLNRSLLVVGREYHFPIDFMSRKHKTLDVDDGKVKSFAYDMLTLLEKSQEVYSILIQEHPALHREYRNSQLNNPRKFKVGEIVFTNVQVQSNKQKGRVGKLSYTKRGPYKIIKAHKSGSYDLQPVHNPSATIIKKHGSDLVLSPKIIAPVQPLESSDLVFSNLNKKMVSNPFELLG